MDVGVDIGGSLTKVVTIDGCRATYRILEHTDPSAVANALPEKASWYVTGCGGRDLARVLESSGRGPHLTLTGELDSFCAGAQEMVKDLAGRPDSPIARIATLKGERCDEMLSSYTLVSFGTGTSVFHISRGGWVRAGATGVGGGTIIGLAKMLLHVGEWGRISEMASRGDRRRVDLMVSDLYPEASSSPVHPDLTASNFGCKDPSKATPDDVASAIVQMAVETVAGVAIQVAQSTNSQFIVVGGSPASHQVVRDRFLELGNFFRVDFVFLEHGAFCGALGAILLGRRCAQK